MLGYNESLAFSYFWATSVQDDDEADTVGCCTLKVENVTAEAPNKLKVLELSKYPNSTFFYGKKAINYGRLGLDLSKFILYSAFS